MRLHPSIGLGASNSAIWDARALPGAVAWWRASDAVLSGGVVQTITDRINGHVATRIAGAPTRAGTLGTLARQAIVQDGVTDDITIPDHADFEFGSGTFAIFMVMRFVSGTGGFHCPFGKGSDTAGKGWRCFRLNTNKLALYPDNASAYVLSTLTLADGVDAILQWGVDSSAPTKVLYAKGATRERHASAITPIVDATTVVHIASENTPGYQANIAWGDIIIYKRAVGAAFTDAETSEVNARLADYYGL